MKPGPARYQYSHLSDPFHPPVAVFLMSTYPSECGATHAFCHTRPSTSMQTCAARETEPVPPVRVHRATARPKCSRLLLAGPCQRYTGAINCGPVGRLGLRERHSLSVHTRRSTVERARGRATPRGAIEHP